MSVCLSQCTQPVWRYSYVCLSVSVCSAYVEIMSVCLSVSRYSYVLSLCGDIVMSVCLSQCAQPMWRLCLFVCLSVLSLCGDMIYLFVCLSVLSLSSYVEIY